MQHKTSKRKWPASTFSFKPLANYLESLCSKPGQAGGDHARLLETVRRHPEILGRFNTASGISHLRELAEQLISLVLAPATWDHQAVALFMPLKPVCLYASPLFRKTLLDSGGHLVGDPAINSEIFSKGRYRMACHFVLHKHYGLRQPPGMAWQRTVPDPHTGLPRHFRFKPDFSFMTVETTGPVPELGAEDQQHILGHLDDPEVVETILPLENFRLNGFMLIHAEDITESEVLAAIGKDLIDKNSIFSPTGFHRTEERLRTLFRRPDLVFRLAAIHGDRIFQLREGLDTEHGQEEKEGNLSISRLFKTGFHRIIDSDRILVIPDLLTEQHRSWVDRKRIESGIRSLLILPLSFQGEIIGVLDIGSPRAFDIGPVDTWLAEGIMPLFAVALKRGLDDLDREVQGIIRQECTAVHPSVEWRFKEVALEYLEASSRPHESNPKPLEPVVFRDVYQLFAASDIRGSTEARNKAVQEDLQTHLGLARNILDRAGESIPLGVLKYQSMRVEEFTRRVNRGVRTGDERLVSEFMKKEFEPLFPTLYKSGSRVARAIDAYDERVDPSVGTVYGKRKDFEESIARLNSRMARYLDQEQREEQSLFSHYFDKHQTDGLEYLIYLGSTMTRDGQFAELYAQNLRLWQISLACGLAWHAWDLSKTLKLKLEVTHLVIVNLVPLSIRFRFDEKRFDVDGAYNIAHEIVRSRIQKAVLQNSRDRLTQPGQIAIIHSTDREREEILRHVSLLQNETFLLDKVEHLDLEDLGDVQRLRAIRVTVNVTSPALAERAQINP